MEPTTKNVIQPAAMPSRKPLSHWLSGRRGIIVLTMGLVLALASYAIVALAFPSASQFPPTDIPNFPFLTRLYLDWRFAAAAVPALFWLWGVYSIRKSWSYETATAAWMLLGFIVMFPLGALLAYVGAHHGLSS